MTHTGKTDDEWQRIAGSTQVLVRSRIEIARLLAETAQRECPVSAFFVGNEALFVAQLRHVDPDGGHVFIDYSSNRMANGAILTAPSVTFSCSHMLGAMEFLAVHPVEATRDGTPMIRFDFPDTLMLHQRRVHRRIRAIPEVPLRCVADAGSAVSFECRITDIACGGIGAIAYDSTIILRPGIVLKGCVIAHPDGTAIEVDIEVRHCTDVVLPDGRTAQRAGCRFIGAPSRLEDLIKVFVLDMEARDGDDQDGATGT